ncbi:extracellular solute-binding protein [Paenibacillus sp. WLX2291]|uniref:extracellular solute-binding protein n=1 Tax=Paenibacillus sp. WLX2291 TaxID=3296934 RepID=UPI003983E737
MVYKRKAWHTVVAGVLTLSIVGSLAGCGGGEETAPIQSSGKLKVTFTSPLYDAQPYKLEGNPVFEEYETLTKSDISVNYVPNANYPDKLNLSLASGDLTEIVMVPASFIKSTAFVNAARGGTFWDISEEIQKYPNIMKNMSDVTIENTSVDGKLYGVPIPRPTARVGLLYRKDLFDSLGIKVPTNLEEFYDAAKEMKAKKPDIIPFSYCDQITETTWNGLDLFTVSQGGYNIWGIKDGKVEPYYQTPEYMNVINTFKKMYNEGLMNKDFAIVQGAEKKNAISTGKSAMFFTAYDDLVGIQKSIKDIDPNAEIGLQPVMNSKTDSTSGHNGLFVIPKSKVKTKEELDAILAYFDSALNKDINTLFQYGIEGTTYNIVDGSPKFVSDEADSKQQEDKKPLIMIRIAPIVTRWPNDTKTETIVKDAMEKYAPVAVPNLVDPYMSDTVIEKGGDLDKIIYDARVKYIMGEIDDAGYSEAITNWKNLGGNRIIEEYNAAYSKLHG